METHSSNSEVTILTCFTYTSLWQRWQGFRNMGLVPPLLKNSKDLLFYKVLGSGSGNGFSKWPHWGQYFMLTVWSDLESAEAFFNKESVAPAIQRLRKHRCSEWSLVLEPYKSFGAWDRQNPFSSKDHQRKKDASLVVLTRAQIKFSMMWRFWRDVPEISSSMKLFPDCYFAVGIGELPLIQQATISIWNNEDAMKNFAYKNVEHRQVVKKTRELKWYSEELFARFNLLGFWGDLPKHLRAKIIH